MTGVFHCRVPAATGRRRDRLTCGNSNGAAGILAKALGAVCPYLSAQKGVLTAMMPRPALTNYQNRSAT